MFTIDAQGTIRNLLGSIVPRDITNAAYQAFIHWQTNGPHPLAALENVAHEAEAKVEEVIAKVEAEVGKVEQFIEGK